MVYVNFEDVFYVFFYHCLLQRKQLKMNITPYGGNVYYRTRKGHFLFFIYQKRNWNKQIRKEIKTADSEQENEKGN